MPHNLVDGEYPDHTPARVIRTFAADLVLFSPYSGGHRCIFLPDPVGIHPVGNGIGRGVDHTVLRIDHEYKPLLSDRNIVDGLGNDIVLDIHEQHAHDLRGSFLIDCLHHGKYIVNAVAFIGHNIPARRVADQTDGVRIADRQPVPLLIHEGIPGDTGHPRADIQVILRGKQNSCHLRMGIGHMLQPGDCL